MGHSRSAGIISSKKLIECYARIDVVLKNTVRASTKHRKRPNNSVSTVQRPVAMRKPCWQQRWLYNYLVRRQYNH